MSYKWNILDVSEYAKLKEDDYIVYAREKTNDGYDFSETNQLVFNLKKPLDSRGQYYKEKAIDEFVFELNALNFPKGSTLIPAPSSKRRDSDKYDDRIDRVVKKFHK